MALSFPLDAWVGLGTGGRELIGGGYAREPISFAAMNDPDTGYNDVAVYFPMAAANWGTITDAYVYDVTNTTLLGTFGVADPPTVYQYERVEIPIAGMLVVLVSGPVGFGLRDFGVGKYATGPTGLAPAGYVGTPYNDGGYGVGPYQASEDAVQLLKVFAPVALCGGEPADWSVHGPYEAV
jgi:hypothetical protein